MASKMGTQLPLDTPGKALRVPRLPLRNINLNIQEDVTITNFGHSAGTEGPNDPTPKTAAHHKVVSLQELAAWAPDVHGMNTSSCVSSRDSSPSRSSVGVRDSHRWASDSGATGGGKRNYAAGPRSYIESQAKRPGLETGDVVVFLDQDIPYTVTRFQETGGAPGLSLNALQLGTPSDTPSSKACHLEVIRQGAYVGFRSATADDRFLQVRRRGKHRLVFYNSNFGVWEQWELVGGQPTTPWDRIRLGLRNRQLQQFTVTVDVMRVGSYAVLPHTNLTPRSLVPLDQFNLDSVELNKMGELMVSEWFHFVDKEKQARVRVDFKVNDLLSEMENMKQWALLQVESIRTDLDAELGALSDLVVEKDRGLADIEDRLTARVRWGVAMLQRKREAFQSSRILQWWRRVAAHQRQVRQLMRRQQECLHRRQMKAVFAAWGEYTLYKRSLAARFRTVMSRTIDRRMTLCLRSWRGYVEETRRLADEHELQNAKAAQQHASRRESRQSRCILSAWRASTVAAKEARTCAMSLAAACQQRKLGAIVSEWREWSTDQKYYRHVVSVGLNRYADRLTATGFSAWREHSAQLREHRSIVDAKVQAANARLAVEVLRHWAGVSADKQRLRSLLFHGIHQTCQLRLQGVLRHWLAAVQHMRARKRIVAKALVRKQRQILVAALSAWRASTARARQLSVAANRVNVRRTRLLTSKAFLGWLVEKRRKQEEDHKVQFFQNKHLAILAMSTLAGWRMVLQQRKADAALADAMQIRRNRRLLSACLRAMEDAVFLRQDAEVQVSQMLAGRSRQLQGQVLLGWLEAVKQKRSERAGLQEFILRAATRRLAAAFSAWRQHTCHMKDVAELANMAHANKMQSLLQDTFSCWLDYADERRRLQDALQEGVMIRARYLMSAAFTTWLGNVQEIQRGKQRLLEFVDSSALRHMRRALCAWREVTEERLLRKAQLRKCIRSLARIKLQWALSAWRSACDCRRAKVARVERATQFAARRQLDRGWSAWKVYMEMRISKAAIRAAQHRKWNTRMAGVAFIGWRNVVALSRTQSANAEEMARSIAHRELVNTFGAWRSHVQRCRRNLLVSSNAAIRISLRSLRHAFSAWQEHTAASKAWHGSLIDMAEAGQADLASLVLQSWREFASQKRVDREAVAEKKAMLAYATMDRRFSEWRTVARKWNEGRALVCRLLTVSTADAFMTWRENARLSRAVMSLAQRVQYRHSRDAMSLALEGWREAVASSKAAVNKLGLVASAQLLQTRCPLPPTAITSNLATWHHAQKLAAFASWVDYVQTRRWHRIILSRAVAKLAKRTLRTVFQSWRGGAASMKQRAFAVACFQARRVMTMKSEAFAQWRAIYNEHKAATQELQACIMRRRISFEMFKSQYWEAMEKGIQGTLENFYQSAEATIDTPGPAPNPYRLRGFEKPENALGLTLPPLRSSQVTLPFGERSKPSRVSEESQADDVVSMGPMPALPSGILRTGESAPMLHDAHQEEPALRVQVALTPLVDGGGPTASPESAASVTSHNPSHALTPFPSTNGLQLLQTYGETPAVLTKPRLPVPEGLKDTPVQELQPLPLALSQATGGLQAISGRNTLYCESPASTQGQEGFGETPARQLWTLPHTPMGSQFLSTVAEAKLTPVTGEDITNPGSPEDGGVVKPLLPVGVASEPQQAVVGEGFEVHTAIIGSSDGKDSCEANVSLAVDAEHAPTVPTLAQPPSTDGDLPVFEEPLVLPGPAADLAGQAAFMIVASGEAPTDCRPSEEEGLPSASLAFDGTAHDTSESADTAAGAEEQGLVLSDDGVVHSVLMDILEKVVSSEGDLSFETTTSGEIQGSYPEPQGTHISDTLAVPGVPTTLHVTFAEAPAAAGDEHLAETLSLPAGSPAVSVAVAENGSLEAVAGGQPGDLTDLMDAVSEFAGSDFGSSEVGDLAAALGESRPVTPSSAVKLHDDPPDEEHCSPPCTLSPLCLELSLENVAGVAAPGSRGPTPPGSPGGGVDLNGPCVGLLKFPTLVSPLAPHGEPSQSPAPSCSEAHSGPGNRRPPLLQFMNFRASIDTRTSPQMGSPAPPLFPSGANSTLAPAGATPWHNYTTPGGVPGAADGPSPDPTAYASAASLMGSGGVTPLTNGPPSVTGPYQPHHGSESVPRSALSSAVPYYYTEPVPATSPAAVEASIRIAADAGVKNIEGSRPPNVRVHVAGPTAEDWEDDVTPDAPPLHGQRQMLLDIIGSSQNDLYPSGGASDTEECYYTQPPALDCPSTGSGPIMPKPFNSWHGPLPCTSMSEGAHHSHHAGPGSSIQPVMVDNPLSQSPAAFPAIHCAVSADEVGTGDDVCTPTADQESFEAKLAAVASPYDPYDSDECGSNEGPEPVGSAERLAFKVVVKEMEELFIKKSAEKSGLPTMTEADEVPGLDLDPQPVFLTEHQDCAQYLAVGETSQVGPSEGDGERAPDYGDSAGGASTTFFNPAFTRLSDNEGPW